METHIVLSSFFLIDMYDYITKMGLIEQKKVLPVNSTFEVFNN